MIEHCDAVHPDCQGQGVGTWMYEYAVEQLREAGMRGRSI